MNKRYQCKECSNGTTAFDTQEELLNHKWTLIKSTKRKSHMRCHICSLHHHTFEGLVRHYQINHPAKQVLKCPGCDEVFSRIHMLMGHLERDECPVIGSGRVQMNRMLEVHATNMLAAATDPYSTPVRSIEGIWGGPPTMLDMGKIQGQREIHVDTLTNKMGELDVNGKHREGSGGAGGSGGEDRVQLERPCFSYSGITLGDFGGFINIKPKVAEALAVAVAAQTESQARADKSQQLLLKDCEAAESEANAASAKLQFRQGDSKGPDLLTDDNSPIAQRINKVAPMGMPGEARASSVSGSGAPNRGGAPAFGATTPGIRAGCISTAPSVAGSSANAARASAEITDIHNPKHPRFNVNKYRDPYSGRYSCPHEMCFRSGKQYRSSVAMIQHLLSDDAHSESRNQCPSCFKWFNTLNALTQHIESPTTRCHFRETDEFVPFINILSAGVVGVQGHHADMTLSYGVQPTAAEALLEDGMLRPAPEEEEDDADDATVW